MRRDVQNLLKERLSLVLGRESQKEKHPPFLWTVRKAEVKAAFCQGRSQCEGDSNQQRNNPPGRQEGEADPGALSALEFHSVHQGIPSPTSQ